MRVNILSIIILVLSDCYTLNSLFQIEPHASSVMLMHGVAHVAGLASLIVLCYLYLYILVGPSGSQDYAVGTSVSGDIPSTSQLTTPLPIIAGDMSSDKVCQSLDPSQWFPVTAATVDFWLAKGPESCRNEISTNNYPASERRFKPTTKAPKGRIRRFGNRLFYSTAPNGEKQSRK